MLMYLPREALRTLAAVGVTIIIIIAIIWTLASLITLVQKPPTWSFMEGGDQGQKVNTHSGVESPVATGIILSLQNN